MKALTSSHKQGSTVIVIIIITIIIISEAILHKADHNCILNNIYIIITQIPNHKFPVLVQAGT